ncbi:hypothetical protein LDENG_00070970 [Lucifuga dentata]|nr:hypothetical protein LDENG_00070970 [Lucifuga dentata]
MHVCVCVCVYVCKRQIKNETAIYTNNFNDFHSNTLWKCFAAHPAAGCWNETVGNVKQPPQPQPGPLSPPGGLRGVPKSAGRCNPSSVSWVLPRASSPLDVPGRPPQGDDQGASLLGA